MKIVSLSQKLSQAGLPKFWQIFVILHILSTFVHLFIADGIISHIALAAIYSFILVGVIAGIWKHHLNALYPWPILVAGEILIAIALFLKIGTSVDSTVVFWVKELSFVLIGTFAFIQVFLFEKRYHLKGLTSDLALLLAALGSIPFIFLPTLLHSFLFEITLIQQLLLSQVFLGLVLLINGSVYALSSKRSALRNNVLLWLVSLTLLHFISEAIVSFQWFDNDKAAIFSEVIFRLAGSLSIVYVFIEHTSVSSEHVSHYSFRFSSLLTRFASIFTILVIPVGVITRWFLDMPPLNLLFIGVLSFILNSAVMWRLIMLSKSSEQQKKQLESILHTDSLTGLSNYLGYLDQFSLEQSKNLTVISLNIDDFKAINNRYGIQFGDEVLKSLAHRLQQIPDVISVIRANVDLFFLVYRMPKENIQDEINVLQTILGRWDTLSGKRIPVSLSYGASYSKGIINPEQHASQAELAIKIARDRGLSFYLYRDDKIQDQQSKDLRGILQKAIDCKHLPIHFQPIYNLGDGSLKAMEMLIRVDSDEYGLLQPSQFLEQAKSYGLLTELTHVCVYMISQHYADLPDVIINVNLPPYMLDNKKLLEEFIHCFEQENLPPEKFCIEVTEEDDLSYEHLIPAVKTLKDKGFSIAMDDFGTGYSSLSRLSILPVDTVKIDRSLLLTADSGDRAALDCAITLIKRLGLLVVVEGVETSKQLSLVKSMGADAVQGFFFSKPVSIAQAPAISLRVSHY